MKKSNLNEIKRMQQLAGLITESQLEEVDDSLLGGIAKNMYLYLSKIKPNNPVDIDGTPLKNIKGNPITHDKKAEMTYQNPELAKQGKAKELRKIAQGENFRNPEVSISYYGGSIIFVSGFVKKEEAEAALKYILDKYPNKFKSLYSAEPKVVANKTDYEWAKNYAPRYDFDLKLKDDKELAKAQSAKPAAPTTPTPQQESININSVVNEALKKFRKGK
jgi:hypothetical protein